MDSARSNPPKKRFSHTLFIYPYINMITSYPQTKKSSLSIIHPWLWPSFKKIVKKFEVTKK